MIEYGNRSRRAQQWEMMMQPAAASYSRVCSFSYVTKFRSAQCGMLPAGYMMAIVGGAEDRVIHCVHG